MKQLTFNKKDIGIHMIFFLMMFHGVLEEYSNIFKYVDELFTVAIFILGIFYLFFYKGKFDRTNGVLLIGLVLFNLMGWMSSIISGYRDIKVLLASALLSNKFFLVMIGTMCLLTTANREWIMKYIRKYSRPMMVILFLWQTIANATGKIPVFSEVNLCAKTVFLTALIFFNWRGKKDWWVLLLSLLLLISTGKGKAYGAVLLIIIFLWWIIYLEKRISILEISVMALGLMVVAWNKIVYYFVYGLQAQFPRIMLMKYGAQLANIRFPWGTGWGTFGSHYAAEYYSPVYVELGWINHFCLGIKHTGYLNDSFWPTIYTESGWIGFLGFILFLVCFFLKIQNIYCIDKKLYAGVMLSYSYLLITTIESTAYSQPSLILMGVLWGIAVSNKKVDSEQGRYYNNEVI